MLALLGRNDLVASEEPPAPPELSPARQRLADAITAVIEASQHHGSLLAMRDALQGALDQEKAASIALEAVGHAEQAALQAWSESPDGPMPAPQTELRQQRTRELAEAKERVEHAQLAAAAMEPKERAAHTEWSARNEERFVARRDVILEAVEELGVQFRELTYQRIAVMAALSAIDKHFRHSSDSAFLIIMSLLRGGEVREQQAVARSLAEMEERNRKLVDTFIEALVTDATASFTPDATVTGEATTAIAAARQADVDAPRLERQEHERRMALR